ncbi:beta-1,3-galactosyltransferase 5-like [Rhinatrema bivittatum]|uniref:beta-1,3-galactosyltransferase 5-like n=1 Tax=Rhinatrema bivittatum TaxID=194408 RepID=UPI00112CF27D|nr:beta-1,3-galactosyltransferase 5-like [Rhinatrema bivittatum]XP_029433815.1 beta-1,3-galactosyltransferase 5-like [Rhinatrema bivittatum]XP_029433816.1 beta-1,3-galactosyltransferase 5-like [Rhinatrema bivittatum]XP_029433817.1 beta-1,3-galactosyltransferase 5-like [Rhinatrema bivittatum]XP_029433818.1 beta-1,3-galactosyltransferase 5-like [Rhinatrema bivittatum]XP_029433819.1 beta-1,3-galactosyltransferase 5-like [Rhinatrema bivittatum]XP_029433821.1 beta-1,3-galactosyltransferase 5-like 
MALRKTGILGIFSVVLLFASFGLFIELNSVNFCIFCHKREAIPVSLPFNKGNDTFLLLPDTDCRENPPFLVILITTEPWQLEARAAIRQTWGKERIIEDKRVVSFFLLGTMEKENKQAEASIISESLKYKDIIQKNFTDSYYNLTLKTLMGIEWVHHFCPQSSFVMKTDSDMFVNTFYLTKLLVRKNRTTNFFTGFLKPEEYPIRSKFSKWYISEIEYPWKRYPPFCSGTGYVFSTDVAKQIYNASPNVPYFKLEDVYVGLCLNKLGILLEELHTEQTFFPEKLKFSVCGFKKIVACHHFQPYELLMYWNALQNSQDEECT